MRRMCWIGFVVLGVAACSSDGVEKKPWDLLEEEDVEQNNDIDDHNNEVDHNNDVDVDISCLPGVPEFHRPDASMCDDERRPGQEVTPGEDSPDSECTSDADCTDGHNGRCSSDRGWMHCTYDRCRTDDECGNASVCECEGGFRSDHNVCLSGNCATDSDCGPGGYCSPSFGDCGNYGGTVGYFCRTCEDECVNDSDCADLDAEPWGAPYCMYDEGVGHWRCANSHCVG